jgi:hypothetical protein
VINPERIGPMNDPMVNAMLQMEIALENPPLGPDTPGCFFSKSWTVTGNETELMRSDGI